MASDFYQLCEDALTDTQSASDLLEYARKTLAAPAVTSTNGPAPSKAPAMLLRPYQVQALAAVKAAVERGERRLMLSMPTGSGKTIVFSHLAQTLGLPSNTKILILAHRDELVQQAVDKYLRVNQQEFVGVEKAESRATPMHRVCVASVQTLRPNRLAEFKERWGTPGCVVTDEAHHAGALSYLAIYKAFGITKEGSVVHVGVTATPNRADGVGLACAFDSIVYNVSLRSLIEKQYLADLRGYVVKTTTDLDEVKTTAGDFNQGQLGEKIDTPERNAQVVLAYRQLVEGRRTIVFASRVQHSKNLCEMFNAAGYPAAHIDGETNLDERRQVLRDFRSGRYLVLTNCGVLTEGYDEDQVDGAILARPTKSGVLYSQMIGRVTRLRPGKTWAFVIDMVDNTKKHKLVGLSSLFGLPPKLNLAGKSAAETAAKFETSILEDASLAERLETVEELEQFACETPAVRMARLVARLLLDAKKRATFIPVSFFPDRAPAAEIASIIDLNWRKVSDDRYTLRLPDKEYTAQRDVLGKWNGKDSAEEAFGEAESDVYRNHKEHVPLVYARARWKREPASDKQRFFLKKHRVDVPDNLTKGRAAELIDLLKGSL